ncbi:GDNF family receptor alpha-4-like [Polyodon spathula]|uniref:GDNF family receptor alpha-4-like n=1 Tax=Polyodon spathula TaxID=7913 RepID=UPI001B7E9E33|nr:GDNF family receptor alpha-4-like [Polyodon spathula]
MGNFFRDLPGLDQCSLNSVIMMFWGFVLNAFICGSLQAGHNGFHLDCVEAERLCVSDHTCNSSYRVLEYCTAEEAISPLGPEARKECVTAEAALAQSPLLRCKCHRGNRREEHCLSVYWTVRFSNSYYELESSPYEDLETDQMWAIQNSRLAAIVSGSSIVTEWDNPCLEAAQACGLYEKCGNLRSEYVLACTKRVSGSDTCNRQKCHKALRRFLDRVPEEYSFAVLFCQCSNTLCGERRRMAIVPSCSFEEKEKPNCLYLQQICLKDELCKSRLADFHSKCQPSPISATGCLRESGASCLKSYSGLIGTIMTPNYQSNSSSEVSQWCSCEGSGNKQQECSKILTMFTQNLCLVNSIGALTSTAQYALEGTPPSVRPSQHYQHDDGNAIVEIGKVDKSEGNQGNFEGIQLISEKATVSNVQSGAGELWMSRTLALCTLLLQGALL